MAKTRYYVVWRGRQTGIFDRWDVTRAQVDGVRGARFKSFKTLGEAEAAFGRPADASIQAAADRQSRLPF